MTVTFKLLDGFSNLKKIKCLKFCEESIDFVCRPPSCLAVTPWQCITLWSYGC